MKVKFLGTGANGGVPQIDCGCRNCQKAGKKSELVRLRSSLLVEFKRRKIVLDCGPDFRQQLLREDLRLQNVALIVVTHLHFDHAGGLMELSAGKPLEIPVLVSSENKKKLMVRDEVKFLVKAKFIKIISEAEGKKMGVELFSIPHDPNFPTSAVIVGDKVWYSPDVKEITDKMIRRMKKMNLVVFDATFLNEDVLPARKFNHTTIEDSAPKLVGVGRRIIFSHVNHSEDPIKIKRFLKKFGFELADDSREIIIN